MKVMKKKIILPILLLTAAFLRAQTFTTYPNDPIHLKKTTLSNGLDVFLVEDHNQPMVFGMVVVKAGGSRDHGL